jgi:hypothetical protein
VKVKLLKNVFENGGVKCSRRRKQPDGTYLIETPFVEGAVIEMSDASGQKYIDQGIAVKVEEKPA